MERKRIIKVCGMTDATNIRQVAETGVDWIGLIFWQPSSRCCHNPGVAHAIPAGIQRVGVFVDEEVKTIVRRTEECGLNRVQLHGRETATSIRQLRQRLPQGVEIIKAISILTLDDLALAEDYEPL
ncbi:MAG: phosphoribosylanthranilate isomerase, partial [Prevotella sp.]|nr:phosphoribosylanthranilate isomerase [Prevotella sp.]